MNILKNLKYATTNSYEEDMNLLKERIKKDSNMIMKIIKRNQWKRGIKK